MDYLIRIIAFHNKNYYPSSNPITVSNPIYINYLKITNYS